MISATLREIMESEAEFGIMYVDHRIGKSKAEELRREGFEVADSKEFNHYPRLHHISWKNAKVEGDISKLDEKSEKYSLPQKLWIISMKAKEIKY